MGGGGGLGASCSGAGALDVALLRGGALSVKTGGGERGDDDGGDGGDGGDDDDCGCSAGTPGGDCARVSPAGKRTSSRVSARKQWPYRKSLSVMTVVFNRNHGNFKPALGYWLQSAPGAKTPRLTEFCMAIAPPARLTGRAAQPIERSAMSSFLSSLWLFPDVLRHA
jgi:hypothetical protein